VVKNYFKKNVNFSAHSAEQGDYQDIINLASTVAA
jgi:hypothetical protein